MGARGQDDGRGDVLVCDPTTETRRLIEATLASAGYRVSEAEGADACLQLISEVPPEAFVLNVSGTQFDPLGLTLRVRDLAPDLPVVVLYGPDDDVLVRSLLQAGASDFMSLPVAEPLLLHLVERNVMLRSHLRAMGEKEADLEKRNRTLDDNLRVLERDQQAGFRMQQSLMPQTPYTVGGVTFSHYLRPSLILSGDFIDYFELKDGRLLFFIADVSGHGASSAFVTVLLKSLSRRLLREFDSLGFTGTASMLSWFNQELLACELEQHSTMFLAMFDESASALQYSNAAHFPATILSSAEATDYLEIGGLPLGLYKGAIYEEKVVTLPEVCSLVLFSDGVFEIMSEQTLRAKEEALLETVRCGCRDIDGLIAQLGLAEVVDAPDDIALFTVAKAG
ncbi:MAG: hypothetical protein CMQ24_18115 [Gammaproteobacteria bacterium]|nr:hypothetical protein [Gammaproteobacteria bacterium]